MTEMEEVDISLTEVDGIMGTATIDMGGGTATMTTEIEGIDADMIIKKEVQSCHSSPLPLLLSLPLPPTPSHNNF